MFRDIEQRFESTREYAMHSDVGTAAGAPLLKLPPSPLCLRNYKNVICEMRAVS